MLGQRPMGRVLGALVIAMLVAAGCSDDGDPEAGSTTTTTSLSDTSSTTGPDTTSTTSSSTAPTIDTSGVEGPAEWVPIVVDVYERIHRLDTDPNPERVTEVYSENFEGLADEQETVQFLADEGLHAEGEPPRIIRVEGPTEDDGSRSMQFVVTVEYLPFKLVREDGSVFQEIDDVPGEVQEILRISPSGADGAWRVLVKTTA